MPFQMISGLANAGVNLATGIMNYRQQQDTNALNERLLRESWARDDKSFSRAYDDITSKGFSPLAALGQSFGNTNPMSLEAPQLSMDLSSATGAIGASADRLLSKRIAKAQQEVAEKVADSQIKNVDADTRDKNASADVNESTSAVQILKAKVELDNMIRDGQMSTSQIVGYLNDLKSQGVSDNVVDSLLASFEAEPQNPAAYLSASSLSGNKLLNKEYDKIVQDIAESKQNISASKAAAAYHTALKNMSDIEFNAATKATSGSKDQRIVSQLEQLEKKSKQNWTTITLPATTVAGRTIPAISISNPEELDYAARLYAALAMVETNANEASFQSLVKEHPILGAIMRVLGKDSTSSIFSSISGLFGR